MKKAIRIWYKSGVMIITLAMLTLFLGACAKAEPESEQPAAVNDSEAVAEPEPVVEEPEPVAEEPEAEPEPEIPEAPEAEPAMYTEGFATIEKYEDYGESGSAISGESICVQGYVDSYDEEQHSLVLISDAGKWAVSVGEKGTDWFYSLVEEAVGQHVRVFGKYTGYSDDLAMPSMAFLPKEYQIEPYRLESIDNSFRLTQLDYVFEEPEYDTERTYGRLTYKEPSAWETDLTEDTLFYYIYDGIPSFIMGHYEQVRDTGFDELGSDAVLMDLAESYVKEGDSIIRKQSFKFHGYPALCFETTWSREDIPMPMSMFCYMFIIDDEYYFYGTQEPYLVGESVRRILPGMLKDMKVGEASAADKDEGKKEDSETKDKDAGKKETDTSSGKTTDSSDAKGGSDTANTTQAADAGSSTDTSKTIEQPAENTEVKKPAVPPRSEILGRTFTQYATMTYVKKENNETFTDEGDWGDTVVTAQDMEKYDESTGRLIMHGNTSGQNLTVVLDFSYDSSGNVVYSGDVAVDAPEYLGAGKLSGHRK